MYSMALPRVHDSSQVLSEGTSMKHHYSSCFGVHSRRGSECATLELDMRNKRPVTKRGASGVLLESGIEL